MRSDAFYISAVLCVCALAACSPRAKVRAPSPEKAASPAHMSGSAPSDTAARSASQDSLARAVADSAQNKPEAKHELSSASHLMIKACDNYISVNPESPKAPEVLSIKGSVYYNNKMFAPAREAYERIVDKHPKSPFALDAIRMVAQSHYQENHFDEAQKWYRKMSDVAQNGSEKEEAVARIAQSIYKMAELLESQQRFEDAAAQYERVALEFPASTIADAALLNAGLAYEKAVEWSRAILIYQRFAQKYVSSALLPKSMFRAAKCYEKLQDWDNAAQSYLMLVKNHPGSDLTEASLYNSGFCFENANKLIEAAATFEKLAHSFPKSPDAADVLFRAGEIYGRLKDWPNVTRVNEEFSLRYGGDINRVVQAQCMVGVALYMQNKHDAAIDKLNEAVVTYRKLREPSDVNRFYAAKAQFTIGEIYREQCTAIRLTLPKSSYKQKIRDKSALLDKAVEAYSGVIQYKISEWTTRSVFLIGQSYEDFALGVFRQERPEGLSIDDQLALELGIANAVKEYFVDRALQYHEQNVKLGIKEKIEDKHVLSSKQKLTYLPYMAGENYLALVEIARHTTQQTPAEGFALIAQKLQILQKIAPFQERAINLFLKTLEMGSAYQEPNEFYTKASSLITKTSYTVAETYASVAEIARDAPIPADFDKYEAFVYKKKLLDQIRDYEDNALTSFLKTMKISEAYGISDDFVAKTREQLARLLFTRGRCYDLLCINAFTNPPYPSDISESEKEEYIGRFQEVALNFQEQAFEIYRGILEYAGKKYADGEYVHHAYVRMYQNFPQEFGQKNAIAQKKSISSGAKWTCLQDSVPGWQDLEFDDSKWLAVDKQPLPDSITIAGFPDQTPTPMWVSLARADSAAAPQPAAGRLFFRREFFIAEPPQEARMYFAAPGQCSIFLNGKKIDADSTASAKKAHQWDIAGKLRRGKNTLAIQAISTGKPYIGIMPYLTIVESASEYLPVFPGSKEVLDKKFVAEGTWVFPVIKNFSFDLPAASSATN